jgi:hypothetical protein
LAVIHSVPMVLVSRSFLYLLTLAACAPAPKPPNPAPLVPVVIGASTAVRDPVRALPQAAYAAGRFALDGLALTAPIEGFEAKYAKTLCDDDPIDNKMRHVWAHFPAPCRKAEALPDGTLLTIYTTGKRTPPMRVTGIAWLFGNWPQRAGGFPARVGTSLEEAEKTLGTSKRLFEVTTGRGNVEVFGHGENVFALVRANIVIGFALGEIGEGPGSEGWDGLIGNTLRYEPRPQALGNHEP